LLLQQSIWGNPQIGFVWQNLVFAQLRRSTQVILHEQFGAFLGSRKVGSFGKIAFSLMSAPSSSMVKKQAAQGAESRTVFTFRPLCKLSKNKRTHSMFRRDRI
jgi:hypothetical protein